MDIHTEGLIYKNESFEIIGACMEVHRELGCGFLEAVYQEALALEFDNRNIPYKQELPLQIKYKDQLLNKKYKADFVCFDKIIIELKALSAFAPEHMAQTLNYLKITDYSLGLLVNFGAKSLQYKRIVL
jgi:GxxExxY protein